MAGTPRSGGFDWSAFRAKLDAELDRLEAAYRNTLRNAGVTVFDSRAVLDDAHTVRLATGEVVTAAHILVATGGRPFVPDFPGADLAITSNEIFKLDAPAQANSGRRRRLYRVANSPASSTAWGSRSRSTTAAPRSCAASTTRPAAMSPRRCAKAASPSIAAPT